jgi:uncharacterized membrane protein (UPF0182 family)
MKHYGNSLFKIIVLVLGFWLGFDLLAKLIAELFWFAEVDYLFTFLKRLQTQLVLWVLGCGVSIAFLLGNLIIAHRYQWDSFPKEVNQSPRLIPPMVTPKHPTPQTPAIQLSLLIPIVIVLGVLVAFMSIYYGEVAVEFWQPNFNLPNVTPSPPQRFTITSTQEIWNQLSQQSWKLGVFAVVVLILLVKPKFWFSLIAITVSLIFGMVLSGSWTRVLQYLAATPFELTDPVFNNDIDFYIFGLPVWELVDFWLGGLFLYSLVTVALVYLLSGDSLSQGKFPGFSRLQLRHLSALMGTVMLTLSLRHWLSRYELLYSGRGVTYGASYTDTTIQLPVNTILSVLAAVIALVLFYKTITGFSPPLHPRSELRIPVFSQVYAPYLLAVGLYFLAVFVAGEIIPTAVQSFSVQPNELSKERPFIERSIAFTRAAFGLDEIDAQIFNPEGALNATDIVENDLTIDNIRIWDARPLLQTNRQLQRIRLYYEFPDADIDRYTLRVDTERGQEDLGEGERAMEPLLETPLPEADTDGVVPDVRSQQVIIAPRELDYESVPEQAQTWVNKHLIYTHGYGFTLSPVNQVGEGGLPTYFVKNIGTGTEVGSPGNLEVSDQFVRDSIPIGNPRIYYGEITNNYVMTPTLVPELDYPSGDENVYNTYDGTGGIDIGSTWRRLIFAEYLKDWKMLFTQNFTPETKLLFRRNINERVRAIAPFLRYDRDPYLVVADPDLDESNPDENYLYWIIDAYTTSDRFPYSDPGENEFNYIRNSVKVVIDAYNGDIFFYVVDPDDPIIQTWDRIFPNLFKPIWEMPIALRRHIRYPVDFFKTQSERLLIYHMRDPQVFYNREDQWQIPEEIYGTETQQIQPYYLIMKLPTATEEEFILLHPYTPTHRNNLIAWLAGRSDGEQYGKLLLYQFPKQELVYGPEQIEALINQDPVISQQISLWNRQGSRVVQGNLLVIPIENSLLYVEPLYLEATENSLPTLARVIVVYENRIVMAETLEESLQAIFNPDEAEVPAIIRPVEDLPTAVEEEETATETEPTP